MITVTCRRCDKTGRVSDEWAGRKAKCPRCKGPLIIPPLPSTSFEEEFVTPIAVEDEDGKLSSRSARSATSDGMSAPLLGLGPMRMALLIGGLCCLVLLLISGFLPRETRANVDLLTYPEVGPDVLVAPESRAGKATLVRMATSTTGGVLFVLFNMLALAPGALVFFISKRFWRQLLVGISIAWCGIAAVSSFIDMTMPASMGWSKGSGPLLALIAAAGGLACFASLGLMGFETRVLTPPATRVPPDRAAPPAGRRASRSTSVGVRRG